MSTKNRWPDLPRFYDDDGRPTEALREFQRGMGLIQPTRDGEPACGAQLRRIACDLPAGHTGMHKGASGGSGRTTWTDGLSTASPFARNWRLAGFGVRLRATDQARSVPIRPVMDGSTP